VSRRAIKTELSSASCHTRRVFVRGSRFDAAVPVPFLKTGAFDVQAIVTIPMAKLLRLLGRLKPQEIAAVEVRLRQWLGLPPASSAGGA